MAPSAPVVESSAVAQTHVGAGQASIPTMPANPQGPWVFVTRALPSALFSLSPTSTPCVVPLNEPVIELHSTEATPTISPPLNDGMSGSPLNGVHVANDPS